MIKYGTEETVDLRVCIECRKEKMTRLYLDIEKEECSVCDDCYMKDSNTENKEKMEIKSYTGHDGTKFYKISDGKNSVTTQDNGSIDFDNWPLNTNNKYELEETLSLIVKAIVSMKNGEKDKKEG